MEVFADSRIEKINKASREVERIGGAFEALRKKMEANGGQLLFGWKETATLKRVSLDLIAALGELRKLG